MRQSVIAAMALVAIAAVTGGCAIQGTQEVRVKTCSENGRSSEIFHQVGLGMSELVGSLAESTGLLMTDADFKTSVRGSKKYRAGVKTKQVVCSRSRERRRYRN